MVSLNARKVAGTNLSAQSMKLLGGALAISLVIGAGGCGDSGDSASDSSVAEDVRPSRAEFVKQANAACQRERAGLAERTSEFEKQQASLETKPVPGADAVHLVYLPTMEAQIWRIEELGVPHGEAASIDELLDAERSAVDTVAVKTTVPSIVTAERHFAEADKLFQAYGLTACVTDVGKRDQSS